MKVKVLDSSFLNGIMLVLTEMDLAGYDRDAIAELVKAFDLTADEIHHMLEYVDPDWEKNEVSYLTNVYLAWVEAQE